MKQLLIIPDIHNMQSFMELAERYSLGFEYNDFMNPSVVDAEEQLQQIMDYYLKQSALPISTMHGAFIDVLPCSPDEKIRKVSAFRIEQSIDIAKRMGVSAVVFHTNYNPFLNQSTYIQDWLAKNTVFWSDVLKKHSDISIYLENMFDTSPDIMKELSENLCEYKNFGVCLDYGHAAISGTKPEIWAKNLGKYIKHIHLNDNDLASDLHLAWGNGRIDRKRFYQCYETYMNQATVLIETATLENQLHSLEVLKKDGFLD